MKRNKFGYKFVSVVMTLAMLLDLGGLFLSLSIVAHAAPATGVSVQPANNTIALDYRNLSLNPGGKVEEMRFTWHSTHEQVTLVIENPNGVNWEIPSTGRPAYVHGGIGVMGVTTNLMPTRPGRTYFVHQVAVYDLAPSTTYTYYLSWSGGSSTSKTFRTGGASGEATSFQFLIAGDPQIGAGDGLSPIGIVEATRDGHYWANTLDVALTAFPNVDFVLSVGDQIHSSNSTPNDPISHVVVSQYRHDRLFASSRLHSLPVLAVVGNHDGWTFDDNNANIRLWPMHYNIPAPDRVGRSTEHPNIFRHSGEMYTQLDYWVRWGDTLFFVLDSNGGNDAVHRVMTGERLAFLEDAVALNQDATWKVATFHHPAFSVYRIASAPEKTQIINNFLPHLERLGFDIILNGHAHTYSRSHHMIGAEPQLEQQFLDANANLVTEMTNAVLDPIGIAHIDFNSASGSGFYNVSWMPRPYIAVYNQNFLRNFSIADVTEHTFSVRTYQLNDDGTRSLVDIYTIVRSDNGNVPAAVTSLPQMTDPLNQQIFERITEIDPIVVLNEDAVAGVDYFGLPTTVGIETNLFNNVSGNTSNLRNPNQGAIDGDFYWTIVRTPRADVTWEVVAPDFVPDYNGLQNVQIRGTVDPIDLPTEIINPANLPLIVYVQATILPSGAVAPGYIARWMQHEESPLFGMQAYFEAANPSGGNARVARLLPTYGTAEPIRFFVGGTSRNFNWSSGAPTIVTPGGNGINPGSGLANLSEPAFWHTSFSTIGRANIEVAFDFRSDPAGTGNLNNGPRDWQLEFSFNNEDWTPAGAPITLTGFWDAGITRTLPAVADNQPIVYLRWLMVGSHAVGGGTISATARNHMRNIRLRSTNIFGVVHEEGAQRIDVLMFNDFHGHVEALQPVPENPGAARLTAFIEYQRSQNPNPNNVIVVSGGDEFHGYAVSTLTNGNPTLTMMAYLASNSPAQRNSGIHVALGNHEFSFGHDRAREFGESYININGTDQRSATLLAADLFNAPYAPGTRPDFIEPFDIVTFDDDDHNITIALVGLMTSNMHNVVSGWGTSGLEARTPAPGNPIAYRQAVASLIAYLRNERGVNAVIAVTHMGGNHDSTTYIAQHLDFDGIVSGHIHTRVHRRVNDTPIIEAATAGRALGRFSLIFDEDENLIRVDSWLSESGQIAEFNRDMAVYAGVEEHYDNMTRLMQPFLDETYDELHRPRGPHGIYFNNRASRDLWVSRLVFDYVTRWAAGNGTIGDFIGISNGGGWRNTGFWPRNADDPTNMAELISTMPFDNNVLVFRMHGQDVLSLINAAGLTGEQVRTGVHQVGNYWYVTASGMRILNNRSQEFNVIGSNFTFGGINEVGGDNYPWPGNSRGNLLGMSVLDPDGPRVVMRNGSTITWNDLQALSTSADAWEELGVTMIRNALLASTIFRETTPSDQWQAELTVTATSGGTAEITSPFALGDRSRNMNIIPQWVTVAANPTSGYDFIGWYNGTTRISEEVVHSFTIKANTTLEARFVPSQLVVVPPISIREARETDLGEVVTVRGIATAVYSTNAVNNNAFFLQSVDGTTDLDGILVMLTATNAVADPQAGTFIGHYVEVTGIRQRPTSLAGFQGIDNINTSGAGHGVEILEPAALPTPVVVNSLDDLVELAGQSRPFSSMLISLAEPIQIYSLSTTAQGNTPIRGYNWPTAGSGVITGNNPDGPPRMNTNSAIINTGSSLGGFSEGQWVYVDRAIVHWWSGRNEIQLRIIPGDTNALRAAPTPGIVDGTIAAWANANLAADRGINYPPITGSASFNLRWNVELGLLATPGTARLNFIDNDGARILAAGSGGINAGSALEEGMYWLTEISTIGLKDITVEWNFRSSDTGPRDFQLEYCVDECNDTTNWNYAGEPVEIVTVDDDVNGSSRFIRNLPVTAEGHRNLQLRWRISSNRGVTSSQILSYGTNQIGNIRIWGSEDIVDVDTDALVALIAIAGTRVEQHYTPESWAPFASALAAAQVLVANPTTQEAVDNAYNVLTASIAGLVEVIDITALSALIAVAGTRVEQHYTPESWAPFASALVAAQALVTNPTTQEMVNNAYNVLTASIAGLVVRADFTVLQSLITNAQERIEVNYTPNSWAQLANAIIAAQGVLNNLNATQATVNAEVTVLENAIDALVVRADTTVLSALITEVESLEENDFKTELLWLEFKTALDAARVLLTNPNAMQADVDAALIALQDALTGLTDGVVYKTALQNLITEALTRIETDYTPDTWHHFVNVLSGAQTVLADDNATQVDVNNAVTELSAAMANLQRIVNRSVLSDLIDSISAENLVEDNFTPLTWTPFRTALTNANAVLVNPDATQAQVDEAVARLTATREGLVARANIEVLQLAINEALMRVQANYTPATWTAFVNSLSVAQAVLGNANASQTQVDDAVAALIAAGNSLVEVGATPPVDNVALMALVAIANARVQANYTVASWTPFVSARTTAQRVLNNLNATQAEVDAAYNALRIALGGLVRVSTPQPPQPPQPPTNGWNLNSNGEWSFYQNGRPQTGWVQTGGSWFFMNRQGIMQTGWIRSGGSWYFMNNSGRMQTGWINDGQGWYFLSNTGIMQTGWVRSGNNWYFMNNQGRMQTGWVRSGRSWYFMNNSGRMRTGWINDGQGWYFLSNAGIMQTSWVRSGNNWYFMNNQGRMQTGWVRSGRSWFFMNNQGRMQTGRVVIDGIPNQFDKDGRWNR